MSRCRALVPTTSDRSATASPSVAYTRALSKMASAPEARARAASVRWSQKGSTILKSTRPKFSMARAQLPMFCLLVCGVVDGGGEYRLRYQRRSVVDRAKGQCRLRYQRRLAVDSHIYSPGRGTAARGLRQGRPCLWRRNRKLRPSSAAAATGSRSSPPPPPCHAPFAAVEGLPPLVLIVVVRPMLGLGRLDLRRRGRGRLPAGEAGAVLGRGGPSMVEVVAAAL
jgi:hypothetical protein